MTKQDRNPHSFHELSRALQGVHEKLQYLTQEAATGGKDAAILSRRNGRRAMQVYAMRRARETAFGDNAELFGEPVWDMLLDLFHAEATGRRISISSASIASRAAISTGLRIVRILEERGLVHRVGDTTDQRRSYVHLTEKGLQAMNASLSWEDV